MEETDRNFSNISSLNQLCAGIYNPILDILMLVIDFPVTLYVTVDLSLKKCRAPSRPGSLYPSNPSELLFLHLVSVHLLLYIRVLLSVFQKLAGVTAIRQEYITAFHSCSLIGESLFFTGMTIDLYVSVAHPVAYVNQKASTKQTFAHIFCTFVWMYTVAMGTVIVLLQIPMYHPLTMASFCVSVPVSFFICVGVLIILQSAGSGKGSQTSRPDKTKQTAIRFILNSLIVSAIYFLPQICVLIYFSVTKSDWLHMPCQAQPLLLAVQITEFVITLMFFYNTGKLNTLVKCCLTVFHKTGS